MDRLVVVALAFLQAVVLVVCPDRRVYHGPSPVVVHHHAVHHQVRYLRQRLDHWSNTSRATRRSHKLLGSRRRQSSSAEYRQLREGGSTVSVLPRQSVLIARQSLYC